MAAMVGPDGAAAAAAGWGAGAGAGVGQDLTCQFVPERSIGACGWFFFEAVLCSCAQPMRAYAGYECPDPWIYEASSNPNDLYAVMGVDSRESATRILLRVCFQVFHLITLEYPSLC